MANELIINSRPHETRVALIENSVVSELHIERKTGQELIGNIYRGKVVRVLPGMQAAFVDIGLERSAFLYVSDVHQDILDLEQMMLRNSTGSEEVLDGSAEENDRTLAELILTSKTSCMKDRISWSRSQKNRLGPKGRV
jgi:ribonuclease G